MTGLKEGRGEPGETEIKSEMEGVGDRGERLLNQVSPKCRERRWSDSHPLRHAGNWELFLMLLHAVVVEGVNLSS